MSGKPILDFYIQNTYDPKQFLVVDTSDWKHIKDKTSIIEIIIPGRTQPIVHYLEKNKVNNFTSLSLAVNCISGCGSLELVDLPDGIYKITIKGNPETLFSKTRYYFRATNLELRKDLYYINLESYNSNQIIDYLQRIELFLKGAEANTRYSNIDKAKYLYERAEEMMNNLENCENCKDVNTKYL